MFLDKVTIKVISGNGGNGMVAWRREKFVDKGGPAGGDGGKGGNVYFKASPDLTTLMDFKFKSQFVADSGDKGRSKSQHGRCAEHLYIKVPLGTVVKDVNTGKIIGDLKKEGQELLVAQGGRGGRGNTRFSTSTRRAPQFCEPGEPGIERDLELELKLIADVGLLGFPNAGKSTLISVISAAKPKIADYPFTTLTPNLGVVKKPDGDGVVIADIPGLIEGASDGQGLGHEFLRHVERNRILLHLLDLNEEDPVKNFEIINRELELKGGRLIEIPQIVVLNKADLILDDKSSELKAYFKEQGYDVFIISAATKQGTKELVNHVVKKVDELEPIDFEVDIEEDEDATANDDSDFAIYVNKDTYFVEGGKIQRLINVTDIRNNEAVYRLQNIFRSMGIFKALEKAGIQEGDVVVIGHLEFEYYSDDGPEEENNNEG